MTDLETLRPEVAEAIRLFGAVIEELGLHDNYESALHVLCAELLRLATIEADALIALDCEHDWQVEHKRAEKAEAELAAAQNTIAAQQDTMGALKRKLALAQAELAALKARNAEAQECGVVALCGGGTSLSHEPYESLIGKRVRLLVDEPAGHGEE